MKAKEARGVLSNADVMLTMTPMPSRSKFLGKLLRSFSIAATVIGGGLFIGMLGYHVLGGLSWLESFYYAAMILSGEGPPPDPVGMSTARTSELHFFAGFYALFSGVTFITMVGVLLAPVLHRFLHRFHLELAAHEGE
ncbi:MAG TPA: hypothetical protein VF105_04070 [Gemmatimonadaceae bacterium]